MDLDFKIRHAMGENEKFQIGLYTQSLKKDQLWKMDHILTWSIYTRLNKGPLTKDRLAGQRR